VNIDTLELLGISKEILISKVVDNCVEALLYGNDFDEDGTETRYVSKFKLEIEKKIQKIVDDKITEIANVYIVPKIGEMVESANLQITNGFGEPIGPRKTFIEYIADRASNYMSEKVNCNGISKAESDRPYDWRESGPRITVLMQMYIKEVLEQTARNSMKDVNSIMVKAIRQSAIDAVSAVAKDFKISI